jgi:uncharacterized protein (TIGR02145 family)
MKKLTLFLLIALIAAITAPAATAQIKYVAVVETEVDAQSGAAAKINKAEVRQITAVLRKEALKNLPPEKYNIMTSETVQAQGSARLEECSDENCVITLGSMIGADFIVRGIISKFGTKLTVSVDIYETNDGNLVASSELVQSENTAGLLERTAGACGEMYKTFLNAEAQRAKKKAVTTQTEQTLPTPAPQAVVTTPQPTYQPSAPTYQPPAPTQKPIQKSTPTPTYQPSIPTLPSTSTPTLGTFTDSRDGQTYKTTVIGGKTWMAENLNYQPKSGRSWCYGNDNSNCNKYGRLYDWNTAKTVCSSGWHLPSRQEWNNLAVTAGGNKKAGKKLKAKNGWDQKSNGTDDYGFSALPSGRFTEGNFYAVGYGGLWWVATDYSNGYAYYRGMTILNNYFIENYYDYGYDYGYGFSVRCIKD